MANERIYPGVNSAQTGDIDTTPTTTDLVQLCRGRAGRQITISNLFAAIASILGITAGTVAASKPLIVDANKDLATLRHLTISGNLVTGSTTLSEAELAVLDGVVAGTASASKAAVLDTNKDLDAAALRTRVLGAGNNYKLARGQHTTVAASDTVATGLTTVVAAVASLESDPVLTCDRALAAIGDQAGAPAAGSILIKTFMPTATGDATPTAATTFTKKVNWIAIGT